MAEVYTIQGAGAAPAACPVGWAVTPNGNCGAPGGGRAPAALALQTALRTLGVAVRDPVLQSLGVDGYIGPVTVAAVNRAFTSHIGSGQAAARYRSGQLTQVQVANEAAMLAQVAAAESQRRGVTVPPTPTPATSTPRMTAEIGPAVLEPSPGYGAVQWAMVGLGTLAFLTGVFMIIGGEKRA